MIPKLVLASASPRRQDLISRLGIPFEVFVPEGVDESSVDGSAFHCCRALAICKAMAGLDQYPAEEAHVVVGCDTLVAVGEEGDEQVLGKPVDRMHAREILCELSGKSHRVMTGVTVVQLGAEPKSAVEVSEVTFRPLNLEEIDDYVASGDADGKAGAYGIQSKGRELVAGFRGCYYNIVGLPMSLLVELLPREFGAEWACDCAEHPLQLGGRSCGQRESGE